MDWADEVNLPVRASTADLATVNNHWKKVGPHIHIAGEHLRVVSPTTIKPR